MSTKERYGSEVWNALIATTRVYANVYVQWATVGEIAEKAGVSRGTAKKYLDMLIATKHAKSMKFGKRTGYSIADETGLD